MRSIECKLTTSSLLAFVQHSFRGQIGEGHQGGPEEVEPLAGARGAVARVQQQEIGVLGLVIFAVLSTQRHAQAQGLAALVKTPDQNLFLHAVLVFRFRGQVQQAVHAAKLLPRQFVFDARASQHVLKFFAGFDLSESGLRVDERARRVAEKGAGLLLPQLEQPVRNAGATEVPRGQGGIELGVVVFLVDQVHEPILRGVQRNPHSDHVVQSVSVVAKQVAHLPVPGFRAAARDLDLERQPPTLPGSARAGVFDPDEHIGTKFVPAVQIETGRKHLLQQLHPAHFNFFRLFAHWFAR
eukprot:CAMPEP_0178981582 /NCGR_PEP_ID=MMETSP0795-20121207/19_1 /TAXON_ID=88552 /ORGANISM="Amoebophrya sp., Strain Ameob2" /LENGTH=296 /DNA_ID=CAMNT_0020672129 /DNA_START=94 /DNA_END=985 /DNA_ORIENTATION=-